MTTQRTVTITITSDIQTVGDTEMRSNGINIDGLIDVSPNELQEIIKLLQSFK